MVGFAAMPLLQVHVFKSTRTHHFEGQIAEAPIVGEGLAPLPHPPPAQSASPPSPFHALFQLFFHFLILIPVYMSDYYDALAALYYHT